MERLAERLLNATGRLFKSAMMVAVALVGLFIAILALMSVHGYYTVTVPTSQVKVAEFVVRHKACSDPQYPLYVKFKNESDRTVLAINSSIEAYIRGRSTDIAEYNFLSDDTILKPGDAHSSCWSRPKLNKQPKYTVTASDGKRFEVTAPEGASDDDVTSFVKQRYFSSTYVSLPDGTEIEFPANTDKATMNRISAQTWNKLKTVIKTNAAAPEIQRRRVYDIEGFIYRVRTNRLLTDEEIDAIADANKSTRHKNPFDEFDAIDPRWKGYSATKVSKPAAFDKKTKEVLVLSDDSKWLRAKTKTDPHTGDKKFFDGYTWRAFPAIAHHEGAFGFIFPEKSIGFIVTDNVDYKLRKTSVKFQD